MKVASARSSRASAPEQRDEPGARQLRGALEVHAEARAELVVLLGREVEARRLAPAAQQRRCALSSAPSGTSSASTFGISASRASSSAASSLTRCSPVWIWLLERADLGHHRGCIGALRAQPADLLGQRVAPGLRLLQLGLQRAHGAIPRQRARLPWAPDRVASARRSSASGRSRNHFRSSTATFGPTSSRSPALL